jgi:pyruvate dehydrogenase E2 component (dihydrolipoamide acetyltransferase)
MKFSGACLCLATSLLGSVTLVDAFGVVNPVQTASSASSTAFSRHGTASLTPLFMAEGSKITMPALSSTMKEGRVVSWLKNEGDAIEAGEAIMVVESDKADMDVEAFEDGFLAKIIVQEGEMAPVGEAVALMCESEADIDSVIASFSNGGAAEVAVVAMETTTAAAGMAAPVSTGEYGATMILRCYCLYMFLTVF